jgi:hypothetical protein
LLYTTHCIACHSTEVHWRDKRSASDWASLAVQVRRWQEAASLAWSETDIREVSRYLNESIYHFERTADLASFLSQRSHVSVFPARQGPHQLQARMLVWAPRGKHSDLRAVSNPDMKLKRTRLVWTFGASAMRRHDQPMESPDAFAGFMRRSAVPPRRSPLFRTTQYPARTVQCAVGDRRGLSTLPSCTT